MKGDVIIRPVEPGDLEQLVALCKAHAAYEQAAYDATGKAEQLHIDLFSDPPKLFCLVAEQESRLTGFISFMKQYATWDACEYVYMDCLFLAEASRSKGIGLRLVEHMVQEAEQWGCTLIQWQTPEFNTRAIKFYNRLGATQKAKERFFLEVAGFQER